MSAMIESQTNTLTIPDFESSANLHSDHSAMTLHDKQGISFQRNHIKVFQLEF